MTRKLNLTEAERLLRKVARSERCLAAYYRKKERQEILVGTPRQRALREELRQRVEEEATRRTKHAPLDRLPWFAYPTPAERRAAIEAKFDQEEGVAPPRTPTGTPVPLPPLTA